MQAMLHIFLTFFTGCKGLALSGLLIEVAIIRFHFWLAHGPPPEPFLPCP